MFTLRTPGEPGSQMDKTISHTMAAQIKPPQNRTRSTGSFDTRSRACFPTAGFLSTARPSFVFLLHQFHRLPLSRHNLNGYTALLLHRHDPAGRRPATHPQIICENKSGGFQSSGLVLLFKVAISALWCFQARPRKQPSGGLVGIQQLHL